MKLTEKDLDEFFAVFKDEGCQVTREDAREGVLRLLSLYEFLMKPTPAETEPLRLDASAAGGNVKVDVAPPIPPA